MIPPEDASVTASTGNARDGSAHKNSPQSSSKDPAMNEELAKLKDELRELKAHIHFTRRPWKNDDKSYAVDLLSRTLSHLREGSGTGVRASVYVVEEAEGQIWLSAGGFQASARIDSTMGQALQRLDAELRAPVSPSPDKVEEVARIIDPFAFEYRDATGGLAGWGDCDAAMIKARTILDVLPSGGGGGSDASRPLDAGGGQS